LSDGGGGCWGVGQSSRQATRANVSAPRTGMHARARAGAQRWPRCCNDAGRGRAAGMRCARCVCGCACARACVRACAPLVRGRWIICRARPHLGAGLVRGRLRGVTSAAAQVWRRAALRWNHCRAQRQRQQRRVSSSSGAPCVVAGAATRRAHAWRSESDNDDGRGGSGLTRSPTPPAAATAAVANVQGQLRQRQARHLPTPRPCQQPHPHTTPAAGPLPAPKRCWCTYSTGDSSAAKFQHTSTHDVSVPTKKRLLRRAGLCHRPGRLRPHTQMGVSQCHCREDPCVPHAPSSAPYKHSPSTPTTESMRSVPPVHTSLSQQQESQH